MTAERVYEILLVAGDYDVIQCVRRALSQGSNFVLHNAFNHREALYLLSYSQFDMLIIDSSMRDRHGGGLTLAAVTKSTNNMPVIAYALDEDSPQQVEQLAGSVLKQLDHRETLQVVTSALEISMPRRVATEVAATGSFDDVMHRQMDEINTLFDLSKSLTEVLDLSEVLNRVVEAARHLTNAEEGMILLPEGEELYLRAKVGVDIDTARNFRIKTRDTLAGQVYRSGKATLIGESGPQKVKTEYFVNSLLYVPILLEGTSIGVLGVNNRNKKDPFDLHHEKLLTNLASFAAIAIQNARIHQESLERSRELETLVAASKVVNSSLALDETLPNICAQLAHVLDVGLSEIHEWLPDRDQLVTLARYYEAAWRFGHGPAIDLNRHIMLGRTLESRQNRLVRITEYPNSVEADYLRQLGAQAALVIPIASGDRVLGMVRAFYAKDHDETPPEEILTHIRNSALHSLVNLLNRTDRIMSDDLKRLAAEVNEKTGSSWCELSLTRQGQNALVVLARIGHSVWSSPPRPAIDLAHQPGVRKTLEEQTPLSHCMINQPIPSGVHALLERTESRAVLCLPLIQRGKTRGLVIFADTERDRNFNAREIALAQTIVGQAATALENANLVRDLEMSLHELKNAQDRLVQAARLSAMGELAAVVAHQINNPLTTIIVDTELMLLDEPKDSPNFNSLTAIARAGKRAANVARRLLAIARPADQSAEVELVDVVDTIRGVLALVQTHIERGNTRLITRMPEESLPPVAAVKGRLDDVWLNLMMNAHDALTGQENGQIAVEVDYLADAGSIQVTITDNGPGIPEDIRAAIFSPFFTTKPVGEGTGLGLHVCREVVENIGGTITVASKIDRYTRFTVNLPIAKA
jgi:signal transduction histidine kinase/DNA-binding NarL/FixJ family response regulator